MFGRPTWRRREPVDELVLTILSQNTNDANRDRAYKRLRDRFPKWETALDAPVEPIEEAIRPAGLSKLKSRRIRDILRWIELTFGALDLTPLADLDDTEAIELLTARNGIGVKTAAVLLAFAFDRDLCPVDTHVHRIARRLGWVPEKTSAEKCFWSLRGMIPPGEAVAFHLNLLRFGRSYCTARGPRCGECVLRDDCAWKDRALFEARE